MNLRNDGPWEPAAWRETWPIWVALAVIVVSFLGASWLLGRA